MGNASWDSHGGVSDWTAAILFDGQAVRYPLFFFINVIRSRSPEQFTWKKDSKGHVSCGQNNLK